MILYHFTAGPYLRAIWKHGLTVGDVPTDIKRWKGRIGVWLTSSEESDGHGLEGSKHDKAQYRLSVEVPQDAPLLVKWAEWARQNVTRDTIEVLHRSATSFETWYVYFGVVRPEWIVECMDVFTGEKIDGWAEISPPELDVLAVPSWRRDTWQRKMLAQIKKSVAAQRAAHELLLRGSHVR
jgi:hypothetical protein